MNHSDPGPDLLLALLPVALLCMFLWVIEGVIGSFCDLFTRLDFGPPRDLPQLPPPPAAPPEPVIFRRRSSGGAAPAAPDGQRRQTFRRVERRPAAFCRICGQPFEGVAHDDCNAG